MHCNRKEEIDLWVPMRVVYDTAQDDCKIRGRFLVESIWLDQKVVAGHDVVSKADHHQRGYVIFFGWLLFAFLCYKVANVKQDGKVYDPFEILGIRTVRVDRCLARLPTQCNPRAFQKKK